MSDSVITDTNRRHDFVLLFDVKDGNPNGDPDAGNQPRVDPETMEGLVTDVAIKRKVRDYVDIAHGDGRFKVYVQHGQFLADRRKGVLDERGNGEKTPKPNEARRWMCEEFYDVRMFGAVMSMKEHNAGQVRGPMQLTFARSISPITPLDASIVGPAQNKKDVNQESSEGQATNYGTMGRKALVPYGLYRGHGFFNPHFAEKTGVVEEDLALFWNALEMMWDVDRSAARGEMACRGLYVFSHDSKLGNAAAHRLFELIRTPKSESDAPRSFSDYRVERPADGPVKG
ncbi:MAG: type I-C CRISPR-associated protein Cas7/Csd2, partial [Caldilineaceae bacterium SB0668_bin_21]|nr:type I-C CRISPR-associated protein Cas7/Csd2 [Caldilineaceae bacterium SB0668_bin_21]